MFQTVPFAEIFLKGEYIVEVDRYPFAPKKRVIILASGDNKDCCSLQCLFYSGKELWDIGAVKHGYVGDYSGPQISPLYTICLFKGKLEDELQIFHDIQELIGESEEAGQQLLDVFCKANEKISTSKLKEIIRENTTKAQKKVI